jgi:FKBP-type peptidyl-prolyl cis-trans isomerase
VFAEGVSLLAASQVLSAAPRAAGAEGAIKTASGLSYTVAKSGRGTLTPAVGELALLRWKASCNGVVFDDLFKKEGFYYHRVGSGNLVPGVEEALYLMHAGDVFELEIPGPLGFGPKGKKASPGQPSIPPNATLKYTLELLALPGRDEELLEVTGGGDEPELAKP